MGENTKHYIYLTLWLAVNVYYLRATAAETAIKSQTVDQ